MNVLKLTLLHQQLEELLRVIDPAYEVKTLTCERDIQLLILKANRNYHITYDNLAYKITSVDP